RQERIAGNQRDVVSAIYSNTQACVDGTGIVALHLELNADIFSEHILISSVRPDKSHVDCSYSSLAGSILSVSYGTAHTIRNASQVVLNSLLGWRKGTASACLYEHCFRTQDFDCG